MGPSPLSSDPRRLPSGRKVSKQRWQSHLSPPNPTLRTENTTNNSIPLFADTITKTDYISNKKKEQKKKGVFTWGWSQRQLIPKMYLSKTVYNISIKMLYPIGDFATLEFSEQVLLSKRRWKIMCLLSLQECKGLIIQTGFLVIIKLNSGGVYRVGFFFL